ncbi:hypothetical protein [Anatilimnocola floriformis]|uniref:hypothetical protein n=1 Tax=Anatilimnocola floriformis TaxID=2948575 RepID=UPI0020C21089|nr:hypothetical protein [Anatilimnocola floriformis]
MFSISILRTVASLLTVICGGLLAVAQEGATAAKKAPIPAKDVRDKRLKEVVEIFRFGEARTAKEKADLIAQVITTARDTKDDVGAQFAMLNLAREQAALSGQIELAFEAIEELDRVFEFDVVALRINSLEQASKFATTPEAKRKVVDVSLETIEDLVEADKFERATALSTLASTLALGLRDPALSKSIVEQRKALESTAVKFEKSKGAFEKLATSPVDPHANLVAGIYLAFAKRNWDQSMNHLALGSDPLLAAAAKAELAAPDSAEGQEQVAEAWWQAGEGLKDVEEKKLCFARSGYWYSQAVDKLTGLAKAKAQRRIKDAGDVSAAASTVRTAANDKPKGDKPETTTKKRPAKVPPRNVVVVASGNNSNVFCLNGVEIMRDIGRNKATVGACVLKPGDVITVRVINRFDIMSHWMMFLTEKGERLIETSDRWEAYLPVDQNRWWDVSSKDTKHEPAQIADDKREYVDLIKASAARVLPNQKIGQPIYSRLKYDADKDSTFLLYVVTAEDLAVSK